MLAGYPLPNDPEVRSGSALTPRRPRSRPPATSSLSASTTRFPDKAQFFARFNLDNTDGPLTNPDQTAINPSFATTFLDNQRNVGLHYTRTVSSNLVLESTLGYLRSTPSFVPHNGVQPALNFGDGLFEPFNAAGGTRTEAFGNLFQIRQSRAVETRQAHVHGGI